MSVTIEFPWIKAEGAAEGGELRACRGCLATDLPLFDLSSQGLALIFGELTGVPVLPTDTYPQHVCVMCKHLLSKFFGFRQRCHSAMYAIQEMIQIGVQVSTESLSTLDTSYLRPNLNTTYVQIVSSNYNEEAFMNVINKDTLSNIPPENAVNNVYVKKEDDDIYLCVDGTNDGNIDLAAVIEDSGNSDDKVSYVLSKIDEHIELNESEFPIQIEGVNKENVSCKRPKETEEAVEKETDDTIKIDDEEQKDDKIDITAIEINDSSDDDNYDSIMSNESEESQSNSKVEASKLPTKRKKVNKENVTCKRPRKKNEKLAEVKDTCGDEYDVSSALSERVEASKLPTKRKKVKKENVTCKRPRKKNEKLAEVKDSCDDDNDVSSALSESDDSELQTKRKRVNKENVTRKRPSKGTARKETEGRILNESAEEEQDMLKSIGNISKSAQLECRGETYISFWEKVHQESLKDLHEPLDYEDFSQWTLTQKINQYIYLSKKLATLYNCELKFSCLADQKKEIEDRKSSQMYQKARFKCEYCFKHYSFEETYKRHMVSHDPKSGDVVCEICMYRYKTKGNFMRHYIKYHTKAIACKTCHFVSREWHKAKRHFSWHGGATTVCDQCGKHFSERKLYLMHRMTVHRTEFATTLCLLCGDAFHGAYGLKIHMHMAHIECARCPACDTRFASEDALAVHTANSSEGCPTLSACPVCGHNFPSEPSLREHYDQQHKKEFKCDQCGRVTDTLTQFTRHARHCLARRRLGGDRPTRSEEHIKTHTDTRPYKCPHCPKAFRQMPHRIAHIRTHTKERQRPAP